MAQNQPLSWHQAIQQVLEDAGESLQTSEITERILEKGLRTSTGATPAATVNSQMLTSIKKKGDNSPYVHVGPSTYTLRAMTSPKSTAPTQSEDSTLAANVSALSINADGGLIQAFGMYWKRSAVYWQATTKLVGRYDTKSKPVDFASQTGVYLLFDGRNVVCAGRTGMRQSGDALSRRLFEHTEDRLTGRWDRFSWFGLRLVHDNGDLGSVADGHDTSEAALIATLEALLIEAFEPPQNRRRGDTLREREFIQVEDPEVEQQRALSFIMNKF